MKPVKQDKFGPRVGNCFEACIASILEIPLHEVPDFGGDDVFEANLARFLAKRNLIYVLVNGPDAMESEMLAHMFAQGDVYHVLEGISPRGGPHACVGLNGRLAFDPHGSGMEGLWKTDGWGFLLKRL
jgi:hypothetical protein